jgi:ABC-type transport system involved in cytochrome bd biosynthesis fused ATPase/permease subunit
MSTGAMIRAGLTRIIFDKSLVLSQEARLKINNGKLLAHLSNDVSRLDLALQWLHALWTAPIQIIVCTVLLVLQIGWSALIGIALFILLIPLQSKIMGFSISVRKKSMVYTDARTRTLQELLSSFAILKYFVFEHAYLKRIANIRGKELVGVWKISLVKAGNQGEIILNVGTSVPADIAI